MVLVRNVGKAAHAVSTVDFQARLKDGLVGYERPASGRG